MDFLRAYISIIKYMNLEVAQRDSEAGKNFPKWKYVNTSFGSLIPVQP